MHIVVPLCVFVCIIVGGVLFILLITFMWLTVTSVNIKCIILA